MKTLLASCLTIASTLALSAEPTELALHLPGYQEEVKVLIHEDGRISRSELPEDLTIYGYQTPRPAPMSYLGNSLDAETCSTVANVVHLYQLGSEREKERLRNLSNITLRFALDYFYRNSWIIEAVRSAARKKGLARDYLYLDEWFSVIGVKPIITFLPGNLTESVGDKTAVVNQVSAGFSPQRLLQSREMVSWHSHDFACDFANDRVKIQLEIEYEVEGKSKINRPDVPISMPQIKIWYKFLQSHLDMFVRSNSPREHYKNEVTLGLLFDQFSKEQRWEVDYEKAARWLASFLGDDSYPLTMDGDQIADLYFDRKNVTQKKKSLVNVIFKEFER